LGMGWHVFGAKSADISTHLKRAAQAIRGNGAHDCARPLRVDPRSWRFARLFRAKCSGLATGGFRQMPTRRSPAQQGPCFGAIPFRDGSATGLTTISSPNQG
jgi:hypothetical protein